MASSDAASSDMPSSDVLPRAVPVAVTHSTEGAIALGMVTAVQANYYWVRLDEGDGAMLLCTRRARLKKIGQQVWVGDRVGVEDIDWGSERGAISQVKPRQTALARPPIANAELLMLVFALTEPDLDPWQLSRFLVAAEVTGLGVALALNKCDCVDAQAQQQWRDRLAAWGYSPLVISVQNQIGIEAVRQRLAGQVSVISGPSGVGKSSLINHLIPAVEQRVNAVSGKLGRGRHTTRHVELFALPPVADLPPGLPPGLLADTPGFNQPTLTCSPVELGPCFPEIRQRLQQGACQFSNCLHRDEPGCAVRQGPSWERYEHYLTFLEEAIARQSALEQSATAEETVKSVTGNDGQIYYEPKLEPKRYRRPSRRSRHQDLKALCGDIDDLLEDVDPDNELSDDEPA
ncbi:MAG: small ribosomal subunit biogenesis GTPase RsgA [Cyanobacteria bacterium P01_A01_bin.135]